MSKTDKDKPYRFRERGEYKKHPGLAARNFMGPGGVRCPCCGVDNISYKKIDRRRGKDEIKKQLED